MEYRANVRIYFNGGFTVAHFSKLQKGWRFIKLEQEAAVR